MNKSYFIELFTLSSGLIKNVQKMQLQSSDILFSRIKLRRPAAVKKKKNFCH